MTKESYLNKNLNILRRKSAKNIFLIIFKRLPMKQITQMFLKIESLALNSGLFLSLLAYLFVSSTNKEAISKSTFSQDDQIVNPTLSGHSSKSA